MNYNTQCKILIIWTMNLIYLSLGDDISCVPIMRNNVQCNDLYSDIVHYCFDMTTIAAKNTLDIEYCPRSIHHRTHRDVSKWKYCETDLTEIIHFYASLPHVSEKSLPGDKHIRYGVMKIRDLGEIPLYAHGNIVYDDTLHEKNNGFPSTLAEHMQLMGQLKTDDEGYLLPRSLGGTNDPLNVIPLAYRVNRHLLFLPKDYEGIPRSYWRSNEDWILKFLRTNRNGRVAWRVALLYQDKTLINPDLYDTFRPQAITLQYNAYTDRKDENSLEERSPQISFYNTNDFECDYRISTFQSNDEDKCELTDEYPKQPLGKVGEEVTNGNWKYRYHTAFTFNMDGRQYFYSQSIYDGRNWFIQELLPNGRMGEETDHGFWKYKHQVVFPFTIDGKQYFYGHSTSSPHLWFIQELLSGGVMGSETDNGLSSAPYNIAFPFTIKRKHYIFLYSSESGSDWSIQKLLPGGRMGPRTDSGSWKSYFSYSLAFPFVIQGRHFFYGYSKQRNNWFIQELLEDGKMGAEPSYGLVHTDYITGFPFNINSKQYYFVQKSDYSWIVQELLPNGEMGQETDHGTWKYAYKAMFSYTLNGKTYFYGSAMWSYNWFIQELI